MESKKCFYFCGFICIKLLFLMKDKVVLLLIGFIAVCLTSCLGNNDSDDYKPSGDAQIYYFRLTSDSVKALENVKFAIDQLSGLIYNPDSMAYGTEIKYKVHCSIQTRGVRSVRVKQTALADTLAVWNGMDSLDFSKPVEFIITPYNEMGNKYYTAMLNIHTVKPDSIDWQRAASGIYPDGTEDQTVLFSSDSTRYLMFVARNNAYELYTATAGAFAGSWEKQPMDFPDAGHLKLQQMIYHRDTLVVANNEGELFCSDSEGNRWMLIDGAPHIVALLGELKDPAKPHSFLSAVVKDEANGNLYYARTSDLKNWTTGEEKVPASFPVSGFGRLGYYNMYSPHLLVAAGRDRSGALHNTLWHTLDGLAWVAYETSKPPFEEGREGVMMAAYDDKFYLIGGMDGAGRSSDDIVYSSDKGLSWMPVDTLKAFPENYDARSFSSLLVNKDQYLMIFGGKQDRSSAWLNEVWWGRINRLGFENK